MKTIPSFMTSFGMRSFLNSSMDNPASALTFALLLAASSSLESTSLSLVSFFSTFMLSGLTL